MKKSSIFTIVFLGLLLSAANVNAAVVGKPSATAAVASQADAGAKSNGLVSAEQKLTEAKLRVCQNKQNAIQQRSNQLVEMARNMLNKFDRIASRVEQYYTNKVASSGKTVSNYDTLVAEISAKKSAVQTDLDKATSSAKAFNCASDNPKGQLNQFRTDMRAVKSDLREYRIAIKNLIVAIRSVVGATESSPSVQNNQ
jgi:predicted  nucleic acid-binding Zn-ribbon protein